LIRDLLRLFLSDSWFCAHVISLTAGLHIFLGLLGYPLLLRYSWYLLAEAGVIIGAAGYSFCRDIAHTKSDTGPLLLVLLLRGNSCLITLFLFVFHFLSFFLFSFEDVWWYKLNEFVVKHIQDFSRYET